MTYDASTVVAKLKARRDTILDELADMDSTAAGGKPNAPQGGTDHVGYKRGLYDELAMIEERLNGYDGGAFEVAIELDT